MIGQENVARDKMYIKNLRIKRKMNLNGKIRLEIRVKLILVNRVLKMIYTVIYG